MYRYEFDCYEKAVRTEVQYQDLSIINCYVHLGLERAKEASRAEDANVIYARLMKTLEETMCDHLVSHRWRLHCYRVLKQLMPLMYEIISEDEYLFLNEKLNTLSQFFLKRVSCDRSSINKY
ncbi:hypothetical protein [Alteromonas oceanisediminis]|uniref:hypothetical protein n=1 Tax=Alteromonas oceanisediminis TaxID=2836180 RepID=UPI001BDAFA1F|nr:hypothetical protein [Alteromonas oceanisediminis]MBT0587085.1 hypothetical protein [Alteromonas oceanisediminis]